MRRVLLAYGRSIIRAKTQARKTKIVLHVTSPTHIFGGNPVHHPQSLQGCVLNSPIEVKVPIALKSPPVLDVTLHYTAFQPHGFSTDRAVLTYSSPYHLPTSSNTCSPYRSQCCCPKSTPKLSLRSKLYYASPLLEGFRLLSSSPARARDPYFQQSNLYASSSICTTLVLF